MVPIWSLLPPSSRIPGWTWGGVRDEAIKEMELTCPRSGLCVKESWHCVRACARGGGGAYIHQDSREGYLKDVESPKMVNRRVRWALIYDYLYGIVALGLTCMRSVWGPNSEGNGTRLLVTWIGLITVITDWSLKARRPRSICQRGQKLQKVVTIWVVTIWPIMHQCSIMHHVSYFERR